MKKILVISTSLNPASNSRKLASVAFDELVKTTDAEFIDLRDYSLPICDGDSCYGNESVRLLGEKIKNASCIIMAVPIYNYDVSASAKNLIELTGKAWSEKVVGFLCAAGGKSSYMAVMGIANSLMLDFRCLIVPRFVYTDGAAFSQDAVTDDEVLERVRELTRAALRLGQASPAPV